MNISVELVPRTEKDLREELQLMKDKAFPIDLINVPELLRFAIHGWEGAAIAQEYGFETMPHIRALDIDLTRELPMKGYLQKRKIRKVLAITGDPPQSMATKVYPTISTDIIRKFQQEMPEVEVFAGIDQYRSSMRQEMYMVRRKLQAGAAGFFTQPFFDLRYMEMYAELLDGLDVYWGISPVLSENSVSYWKIKNNVIFPKDFEPTLEWNIDFACKVKEFVKKAGGNMYIMPIKTNLEKYMNSIFMCTK
ncbi:methylenetetrahydrofolate reductase [Pectinatus cerevisiiphilus]|uniref:Methylenetetrahydrofolate reductase n=1 Tax=Pectinatus cerevisiiphilus TaxID=86956 RepID=A0A4R3K3G6_9FIRM|nr:methylenetetrahydrofolate reductase [Pectinatus cerevisiiphilus]TCS77248.1 methylenetetrahydrofolate reductase (NADPH) [Pectinatus cerevisiiphilus]